jgi:hypothetical protein
MFHSDINIAGTSAVTDGLATISSGDYLILFFFCTGRSFNVSIVLPQQPFEADLLRNDSQIFNQLKGALEQAVGM